ncbi:Mycothiol acetyltransferase [compost metagenome]
MIFNSPDTSTLQLREFVLGDIPAIAEIRNASISISPDFYSMTVDRFRYDFYDEDVPMLSRIEVAEVDGNVAGFTHLYTDENQLRLGRVNLDSFHVHPQARNHGVGSALLASAIETARSWNGRYISTAIPEESPRSLEFLERHGFKRVRQFYKMRLSDLRPDAETAFPPGFSVRTFLPGTDEAAFVTVYNAAFADHWDFIPMADWEIAKWNRRPAFNPKACFLLFDQERLVGFTTVMYDHEQARETGQAVGRIFEMGVLPEYRRQGLGYTMLQSAIRYAQAQGFDALDLVTDVENVAGIQLYEKVGFQEKRATTVLHIEL